MKKKVYCAAILFALTGVSYLSAQSISEKIANKDYDEMRYEEAITWYEQVLKKNKNNQEAKVRLAESYRKTKDVKNAVRLYAELAHEESPSPQNIWHYAQALASDGKYSEAAYWYDQYALMEPDDTSAKNFAKASRDLSPFYQDSSSYRVRFAAGINTWQAEFAPVYYKNGLLFVSNRQEGVAIKRVSEWDETAFLDWYFASDTSTLNTEMNNESAYYAVDRKDDRHPDNTYLTSNDSDTPGHYNDNFLYDSMRYHFDRLTKVTRLESINKKFHEGPAVAFKGGDSVLLTRNNLYEKGAGGKMVNQQALFLLVLKNQEPTDKPAIPLRINVPGFSSGHPALTPDNKLLYFISNRPGGKGGTDIWSSTFDNGVWGKPENVEELNTKGDEMFPFVDAAGNLFFSSDGRPGLGGLDLFKATFEEGKITSIKNMGYPFNSSKDDFSIVWNKNLKSGFFSSNRKRGFNDDDIYGFRQMCQAINVLAYDSVTQQPLDSVTIKLGDEERITGPDGKASFCMNPGEYSVSATKSKYEDRATMSDKTDIKMPLSPLHFELAGTIRSAEDNLPMEGVLVKLVDMAGGTINEIATPKNGSFEFPLSLNSSYTVTASKKSCGTNSDDKTTVGLLRSKVIDGDMALICTGDIIKIENIYYDLNKYNIRADAATELDKLAALMWKYPDMRIELRSHTDSRSSKDFNMRLSTRRAEAAVEYLATKGIISNRMRAAGYGESIPVNKCVDGVKCSEEEYQMNRRTEFKVLSIK